MTKKKTQKTPKASNDTITFKKSELISKLKTFLEDNAACDGDWVNKVRVEFLGEETKTVKVTLQYETEVVLEMVSSGLPSAEEAKNKILAELEEGMCIEIDDYSEFKVLKVE